MSKETDDASSSLYPTKSELLELGEINTPVLDTNNDEAPETPDPPRGTIDKRYHYWLAITGIVINILTSSSYSSVMVDRYIGVNIILYIVYMVIFGIPIMLFMATLGQYLGTGIFTIWKISPIFKGTIIFILVELFIKGIVYVTSGVFSLHNFSFSMTSADLWHTCDNHWNTKHCFNSSLDCMGYNSSAVEDLTSVHDSLFDEELWDFEYICVRNNKSYGRQNFFRSSELEYFSHFLENIYYPQYRGLIPSTVGFLALFWILIFFTLCRGTNKIYQVQSITVPMFVILLVTVSFYFLTFASSAPLIIFPDHPSYYLQPGIYIVQLMIVVGHSFDIGLYLLTISSFNQYKNNCLRDVLTLSVIQTVLFSLCIIMATAISNQVYGVTGSLPDRYGLVYQAFYLIPFALKHAGGDYVSWTVVTSLMAFLLCFNNMVWLVETIITGITDQWPRFRNNRIKVLIAFCVPSFLISLGFLLGNTNKLIVGIDQICGNYFTGIILMLFTVTIGFGHQRFLTVVRDMYGTNVVTIWCYWCWVGIAPALLILACLIELLPFEKWYTFFMILIPLIYAVGLYLHSSTKKFKDIFRPELDHEKLRNRNLDETNAT